MKLKISTLFHWLYATLMFLPILMFIPSCLYYGFNEHATNTETTTINYKYESNEVNNYNDLIQGNVYQLDKLDIKDTSDWGYDFDFVLYCFDFELHLEGMSYSDFSLDELYLNNYYYTPLYINVYGGNSNVTTLYLQVGTQDFSVSYEVGDASLYLSNLIFTFEDNNVDSFSGYCTFWDILPQYTDYNVIESVTVNTDDTITDKVATAWERTWDLPLFAWTQNSFVAAPFSYITGLFGLGSDNSINYVFTYFVSISICWLVFDLIMYVPNLAHRWLDRSAIE